MQVHLHAMPRLLRRQCERHLLDKEHLVIMIRVTSYT
jgi:hypothetical protein